ncbi:putative preprotein translocase subunit SecE [Medicago truncatula]|uniref:Putative preprotein translocase subunit SecE n=1 Tax=Medicago truncatula TaxID=3880 RepID=A0A396HV60_MEDTR|nr:putative preprotein translocase subunit SecE [Medicago truncatula]
MDAIDSVFDPLREFAKDSVRLVKRCHKPDRKEFSKVAVRTAIGFVVMGFVGFFVKLIFIPINNIIVGSGWGKLDSGIHVVKQKEAEELNLSYVFQIFFFHISYHRKIGLQFY